MIHQSLRKKEKPSFINPVGIGLLTILMIVVIALSVFLFARSREVQFQQKHIVTLLNDLKVNQQRLEVLYSAPPGERGGKSSEGKSYVPREEYNNFKTEYIREIKRLRKQIRNLKAML